MAAGMPSGPGLPLPSISKTCPRRFMLSRPMRTPSGVVHIHESPCLPPTDWMMKCRALAGGFARSTTGVWARGAATRHNTTAAERDKRSMESLQSGMCGGRSEYTSYNPRA